MENHEAAKLMSDLCQLDIDAVHAYDIALQHIEDPKIHLHINNFKLDHLTHIRELSNFIQIYGGEPPKPTPDFKGYLMQGMTAFRSSGGLEGALKAMEVNEKSTNKKYRAAIENHPDLPLGVLKLLQSNLQDERHHLDYIRHALQQVEHYEEAV